MEQFEKVQKGLECCVASNDSYCPDECPYKNICFARRGTQDIYIHLHGDALALIRQQQERIRELEEAQRVMARLITEGDFKEADAWGIIPAWIEYRPELEGAEDGWGLIDCDVFHNVFKRAWTQRPTDEQKKAVKWE